MKRKSNTKIYDVLNKKMPDYLIQAGWFEEGKYSNGTSIAGIAAVQNYGGTIHHPGGTPYFFSELAQRAVFLSKNSSWGKEMVERGLITKPHTIVIPPTHFMENCQNKNKDKWQNEMKNAFTQVFLGNINPDKAMEQMGFLIEGDIAKEIAQGNYPPDKPSTVKAKMNRYKNYKKKGNLDKRLVDTGQMLDSVSHKVDKI